MTTDARLGHALELRLPVTHRLVTLIWCVFLALALFVSIFVIEAAIHGSAVGIAAPLIFLGFTVTVAWRWAQVRVVGGASELSVRNVFLTYHIQREAIAGFRSGRFGQLPWGPNIIMFDVLVRVVLKDGRTVALLATMSYIYSFMSSDLPAGHQRALAQLEEWLHPGLPATPTATV